MALEIEFNYYQSRQADYIAGHRGQFVLIKGEAEHGFYPTYEMALQEALQRFGAEPVLIQEITDEVPVNYLSTLWTAAA